MDSRGTRLGDLKTPDLLKIETMDLSLSTLRWKLSAFDSRDITDYSSKGATVKSEGLKLDSMSLYIYRAVVVG